MKIVFIGKRDDSGTSNRICRAINRCKKEMTARCITRFRSKFLYQEDICLERDGDAGMEEAGKIVYHADWIIQLGDDDYQNFWRMCYELGLCGDGHPSVEMAGARRRGKHIATRHSGTLYRTDPKKYWRWDDMYGIERIFLPCDLYYHQKDDPRARPFVQPQDNIVRSPPDSKRPLRVCHCPSSRTKKRTDEICDVMKEVEHEVIWNVIHGVPFDECFARMRRHQVMIDQLTPEHGGFGGAVMEALSQGVIPVLDDHMVCPEVDRWIERPPTVTVQSKDELLSAIKRLMTDDQYFERMQLAAVAWANAYLSDAFTYHYYWEAFNV